MKKLQDLIKELCPDGVPYKKVGDVCDIYTGGEAPSDCVKGNPATEECPYPVFSNGINGNELYGFSSTYVIDRDAVTFSSIGTIGHPQIRKAKFTPIIRLKVIIPKNNNVLRLGFLKYALEIVEFNQQVSSVPNVNAAMIANLRIPVPPVEIQDKVVDCLDAFLNLKSELITEKQLREKQYSYFLDRMMKFTDSEKAMAINTFSSFEQPSKYIVSSTNYDDSYDTPVLTAGQSFILGYTDEKSNIYPASKDSPVIIFDDFTGAFKWVDFPFKVKSSAMKIIKTDESKVLLRFLFYTMVKLNYSSNEHKRLWISFYSNLIVKVPSLDIQKKVVEVLDKFERLANDTSYGIPAEINIRQRQYEYYRDLSLSFKEAK